MSTQYRVECAKHCGRYVPVEFVRGPQKGLCRKCRRKAVVMRARIDSRKRKGTLPKHSKKLKV